VILQEVANPYRPGEPVIDPAMLFGRQDAADWLERQITGGARILILSALPLIGKTSFLRHVGALQNLPAYHLLVSLPNVAPDTPVNAPSPGHEKEAEPGTLNTVLQSVIDQLMPQLSHFNLTSPAYTNTPMQPATTLRHLFAQANQKLGPEQLLILHFDDLHRLVTADMALSASFLTALMPLFDECPRLHMVFAANQDQLKRIKHPLLDGASSLNFGAIPADASLSMVTLPVKDILRFDYGVTKRIVEVNSHHPFYLTLFCHTLLNRQVHDGWVNQRDFDAALSEVLASPIEPFTRIWDEARWVERAVLSGMASMQGRHGPVTYQEIVRFLQQHHKAVTSQVVIEALEALAKRGVLVPMGAVSYRFHVEILRYWLREHTNLAEILKEVDWNRLAAQAKPNKPRVTAQPGAAIRHQKKKERPARRKRRFLWPALTGLLVVLCLLATGTVFATQFLELSSFFTSRSTDTPVAVLESEAPAVSAATEPTVTVPSEPPATLTPTPALVIARTLPAITFMGRDIDDSWRIYVMNADSTGITALSAEGLDDTAPTWSPNGQKIAYVSQRDGNREIYIMDADGQNAVNVTRHPADDWTPAWSPDGSQLAFSSIRSGSWEIYVMNTACLSAPETCGDSLIQITSDGSGNISPVWSPDGTRFAFNSKRTGNWDIFTMNTDGTDVRQITIHPENDLAPAWSPDGSQLAFESNRDGNVEIYVVGSNGGVAQNVSNLSLSNDHGPTWTPDGQQLVFYSNREGNWDIFLTTLDGSNVVNLTNTPSRDEQTPAWRP
jgi:Tol biopolymer transport system component